jgi:hypothetical protein
MMKLYLVCVFCDTIRVFPGLVQWRSIELPLSAAQCERSYFLPWMMPMLTQPVLFHCRSSLRYVAGRPSLSIPSLSRRIETRITSSASRWLEFMYGDNRRMHAATAAALKSRTRNALLAWGLCSAGSEGQLIRGLTRRQPPGPCRVRVHDAGRCDGCCLDSGIDVSWRRARFPDKRHGCDSC